MRASDAAEPNSSPNGGAPRDAAAGRRKTPGHEDVRALLDELIAVFPACFKPHLTSGLPLLKAGVGDDILARRPDIDPALLERALSVYASGPEYWRSVIAGRPRVDLDGAVVQATITADEIAHARAQLQAIQRRAEKRRTAQSAKSPVGQADG